MTALKDMSGQRFGRWLVLSENGRDKHGQALWLCRCDCGTSSLVTGGRLRRGDSVSCGCNRVDVSRAKATKHGAASFGVLTPEYRTWSNMIDRCERTSNAQYADWGGRGITVCERWRNDFAAFLADMGHKPTPEHSIDRINNDGNYEPGNCRWATREEQNNNKRSNRMVTFNGETRSIRAWEVSLGFAVYHRLAADWSVERALTTPPRRAVKRAA